MAAPTALASVAQLAEYIGEEIMANSADEKRAQWALRAASSLVRRNTGNRTWLEDDGSLVDPLPDDIVLVTLAAAARKYTNPEGLEQERQDEWYGSRKVEESGVYLTESEQDTLAQLVAEIEGKQSSAIGTISTRRGDVGGRVPAPNAILPPWYYWE